MRTTAWRPNTRSRFPLDDCWSVLQWTHDHLGERGWDGSRLGVGGTSSGGNLSAAVALRARDRGLPLSLQLLLYPALDSTMATASWGEFGEGYFLTASQMAWYWRQYPADPETRRLPEVSPSQSTDLAGLAPALVVTAEYDLLRDEAEAYADRMRRGRSPRTALAVHRPDPRFPLPWRSTARDPGGEVGDRLLRRGSLRRPKGHGR